MTWRRDAVQVVVAARAGPSIVERGLYRGVFFN
jgi:hypothetical protein